MNMRIYEVTDERWEKSKIQQLKNRTTTVLTAVNLNGFDVAYELLEGFSLKQ